MNLEQSFQNFLRRKNTYRIASFLILILLLPFVIHLFIAFPQTDDFYIAWQAKELGILKVQSFSYLNWSGRYAATFLGSLHPMLTGKAFVYNIELIFLALINLSAIWYLLKSISRSVISRGRILLLTLIIIYLYITGLRDVSAVWYWLPGAIAFQLSITSCLVLISGLIRMYRPDNSRRIVWPVFLSFAAALLSVGLNEISLIFTVIICASVWLWDMTIRKQLRVVSGILLLLVTLASILVIAAPGNAVRMGLEDYQPDIFNTLYRSFRGSFHFATEWFALTPLLLLSILVLPLAFSSSAYVSKRSFISIHPLYFLALTAITLFLSYIPSIYGLNAYPPPRTQNIIWFMLMGGWMLFLWSLAYHLSNRYKFNIKQIPSYVWIPIVLFLVLQVKEPNPIRNAWTEIIDQSSLNVSRQHQQREEKAKESNSLSISFPPMEEYSHTLSRVGMSEDPDTWQNKFFALYFEKDSVWIDLNTEFGE